MCWREALEDRDALRVGQAEAQEHGAEAALLEQCAHSEAGRARDRPPGEHADAEVAQELELEVHGRHGQPVLRDLRGAQAADVLLLLKHRELRVAEPREESGAADARGPAACAQATGLIYFYIIELKSSCLLLLE